MLPEVMREVATHTGLAPGPFRMLVNGALLLAVILWLPNGLVALPDRLRARPR
jgi:ABC-type branched-subunit amino acid transport system permease subunit